jgi:hypothetical protein
MGTIKQNRANNIVTGGKIDATDGLNNNVPATNIANASLTNVTAYPPSAGAGVSQLASDPPSPTEGQMWYNTTTNTLKQYALGAGAWASGGNLNTARTFSFGTGTQTAALCAGGDTSPPGTNTVATELYDGSTWTEVNDLNTGKRHGGNAGTQTSALAFGGITTTTTNTNESWNGSNWTEVADLNQVRHGFAGAGISNTSALAFGGFDPATFPTPTGGRLTQTESWNGTSWTEVNDLNSRRTDMASGNGTATSALCAGGNEPAALTNKTESWDGTSWTEVNDLNTTRSNFASAGADNTSALAFGGQTPPLTGVTEEWNGTSWTEVADLSTARWNLKSALRGTTSASLAFGGETPTVTNATEEWTQAVAIQTITAS